MRNWFEKYGEDYLLAPLFFITMSVFFAYLLPSFVFWGFGHISLLRASAVVGFLMWIWYMGSEVWKLDKKR